MARAEIIEVNNAETTGLQVVINAAGDALALWRQGGSGYSMYSKRYDLASSSWETPQLIVTVARGDYYHGYPIRNPQVAIDATGNALAVWQQRDGTDYILWTSRYGPETSQ